MAMIKIDEVEYELEKFSDEAKAQLANIQFVENELVRLQAQIAVYQTARVGYLNALKASLPEPAVPFDFEKLRF